MDKAIDAGYPAGIVLPSSVHDDEEDKQLRIAFDFDGVIADDEAEAVFKQSGLDEFHDHEQEKSNIPHNPGLLADLFKKLSILQKLESQAQESNAAYQCLLRTAIITARSAPAHERVVTTLEQWGVRPDETFFLGGMDKKHILNVFKPHMFFDDQKAHLKPSKENIPMVHIPFGVANQSS